MSALANLAAKLRALPKASAMAGIASSGTPASDPTEVS